MLVQASDGLFYVVKFNNNLQGPNLPLNEAMGTELYRTFKLPVPEWKPLVATSAFLNQNPACWIQTETGRLRPAPGICFGSRFLGEHETRLLEILPGTSFGKIRNRTDFWLAWMLDVCAQHADNRQAIFIEETSGELRGIFMDHGHLFGGADGNKQPHPLASRYLDQRIYQRLTKRETQKLKKLWSTDTDRLWKFAESLPDDWKAASALSNFAHCINKLSSQEYLSQALDMIMELGEQNYNQNSRRIFTEPTYTVQAPLTVYFL
jgi:hypothetical protein